MVASPCFLGALCDLGGEKPLTSANRKATLKSLPMTDVR